MTRMFSPLRALILLVTGLALAAAAQSYVPSSTRPPMPAREFRGAWVATVANIDWPSQRGLSADAQKAELVAMLDRAAQLNLNALILQVRPACDALYPSALEPWSEYLTGAMGRPPEPYYDPLAFAIAEAHRRGLELHAWFNPYRALHPSAKSPVAANHVSKRKPHIVRQYGRYLWLDPGEKDTQDYSLSVVLDVVRRYDVDGVHFDDYFYPYREKGADGRELDFPDDASWRKYGAGTKLSREDWRRHNVHTFIQRVYAAIKREKPTVKFGLSPFGIWRPGHPPQIKGLDAYAVLYADSKLWLNRGWVDYFTPQLYWANEPREQSFSALLDWWNTQNPERRHIWPGMNTTKAATWGTSEILNQIELARKQPVSAGHVHWNMKSLLRNERLTAALQQSAYTRPALVPPSRWLDRIPPATPRLTAGIEGNGVRVNWEPGGSERIVWWLVQQQQAGNWTSRLLPGTERSLQLDADAPEVIAVTALDGAGNAGTPAVVQRERSRR